MERMDLMKRVIGEHDPIPPSSSHMQSLKENTMLFMTQVGHAVLFTSIFEVM